MMDTLQLAKYEISFSPFATLCINIWNGEEKLPLKFSTSIRTPYGESLDFILLGKR